MSRLRGYASCIMALAAMVFVSEASGASDVMVLRYTDGSVQKVRLDRPSETIRQIEFIDGNRGYESDGREGHIRVVAGTYGKNCGVPYGNATRHLAQRCDGKRSCVYVVDVRALGDPAPGCAKDYIAEWVCGHDPERGVLRVGAEAGGGTEIELRCPVR